MIVTTSIDDTGVAVTIDSDGDQGDGYAPEVLSDLLSRATRHCMSLYLARLAADEDAEAE